MIWARDLSVFGLLFLILFLHSWPIFGIVVYCYILFLLCDPPHQPLAADGLVAQQVQRILRALQHRRALYDALLVGLDNVLREQLRHNLGLHLFFVFRVLQKLASPKTCG